MASEHDKCKVELAITDIEEDEAKRNACRTYFVDIQDILNSEKDEDATEFKPFSEYGVSNECLENNVNGKFDDTNSRGFEVMLRDSVETPTKSKFSPLKLAGFWENGNVNGLAGELSKSKVIYFNDGIILKSEYEDHPEYIDLFTNKAESKTETIKIEDDIDVIYDDVKPDICEEKSHVKSENGLYSNVTDILIGTEIGQNFSPELSKDSETWPQQNREEDETTVERNNDTGNHHERTHTSTKPFQCKICVKNFDAKSKLLYHEIIHTGEKPFQCKICEKSFNRKTNLTVHERIHTGEKLFQCKICSKSFYQKGDLTKHQRIHTGEKPFQCKICGKSFASKSILLVHERIHTVEKPFQCKICLKSFRVLCHLMLHERIHTGEKPFQCKFCPKSFTGTSSLMMHEKIHTGEKSFQCKICLKSFYQKGPLTKHEKSHRDDNSFFCKMCLKIFTSETSLLYHRGMRIGEKPIHCKVCSELLSKKIVASKDNS